MQKNYNWSRRDKMSRRRKMQSIQDALAEFLSRHKGRGNLRLVHLWENWPMVMGDQLAGAALPLGVHDRTLLIGADDSMLMHELSFFIPEMLERANAFMDENYFTRVRLDLLRGRTPLYPPNPDAAPGSAAYGQDGNNKVSGQGGSNEARYGTNGHSEANFRNSPSRSNPERRRPENLGGLAGRFDPESAIGRAYLSYVKSFEG